MGWKRFRLAMTLAVGVGGSACTGGSDTVDQPAADAALTPGFDWYPGHYLLMIRPSGPEMTASVAEAFNDARFLSKFAGVQAKVLWRDFEKKGGDYDFTALKSVLAQLQSKNKKLFLQLQYITFDGTPVVPDDLAAGGDFVNPSNGNHHARLWSSQTIAGKTVNQRFISLMQALHDGLSVAERSTLAGIALPESACSGCERDPSYSAESDIQAMEADLLALRSIFPRKIAVQYINFLPGAVNQTQALQGLADFACAHKAGLGVPDIRRFQPDTGGPYAPPGYPVLYGSQTRVPLSLSVQTPDFHWNEQLAPAGKRDTGTYHLGTTEMGANFMVWANLQATPSPTPDPSKVSFNISDVFDLATELPAPNLQLPSCLRP